VSVNDEALCFKAAAYALAAYHRVLHKKTADALPIVMLRLGGQVWHGRIRRFD